MKIEPYRRDFSEENARWLAMCGARARALGENRVLCTLFCIREEKARGATILDMGVGGATTKSPTTTPTAQRTTSTATPHLQRNDTHIVSCRCGAEGEARGGALPQRLFSLNLNDRHKKKYRHYLTTVAVSINSQYQLLTHNMNNNTYLIKSMPDKGNILFYICQVLPIIYFRWLF